jgi:hypothetical protein
MVQWNDLLTRWHYSCLRAYCELTHREPQMAEQALPGKVLSELLVNMTLAPYWVVDLRKPWLPFLPATDASTSYSFGLAVAHCDPDMTRLAASIAHRDDAYLRFAWEDGDPVELIRHGSELRLPVRFRYFQEVFSIHAKTKSHSGLLEATGFSRTAEVSNVCKVARSPWSFHFGCNYCEECTQ